MKNLLSFKAVPLYFFHIFRTTKNIITTDKLFENDNQMKLLDVSNFKQRRNFEFYSAKFHEKKERPLHI